MRIIVTGILFTLYFLFRCPLWLAGADVPYIIRALSYSFFHANLFHLAVNCLSLWVLLPAFDERRNASFLVKALFIAFIVYPMGFRPCVGFSNVLFAICGLRSAPLRKSFWTNTTTFFFLVLTAVMCFLPQFAGTNHLAAYLLGLIINVITAKLQPLINDVRYFTRDK